MADAHLFRAELRPHDAPSFSRECGGGKKTKSIEADSFFIKGFRCVISERYENFMSAGGWKEFLNMDYLRNAVI